MSIRIMSAVWDSGVTDKGELLVLLALADFCNDEGTCWPSVGAIARKARMTERGVQKITARLCERGVLEINTQAARRGCNLYWVKPPNTVHREHGSPPNVVQKPPNAVPKTPEPRSPEPSFNHQEPSDVYKRDPVKDALTAWASEAAVASFIAYRKKSKGKALTETAAKRLADTLKAIFNAGGDCDDALGMAEERGWLTIKADWYFNEKGKANGRTNSNAAIRPSISGANQPSASLVGIIMRRHLNDREGA